MVAILGCGEEDGSDAVLGFGSVFGVGVVADQLLVGRDGPAGTSGARAAALVDLADGELGPVGGGGAWGIVANLAQHGGGFFDVDAGLDADEGVFDVTLGRLVGDGFLTFDGFRVVRGSGVFCDDGIEGVEGIEQVAIALEELGVAVG